LFTAALFPPGDPVPIFSATVTQRFVEKLTIFWCSGIIITPIPIVANVSGPEDAVQKPQSHPIWCMLSICLTTVEQSALFRPLSCLMPGLHYSLTAFVGTDVVPKEGCFRGLVVSLLFYEACAVCVDFVVNGNGFVLYIIISTKEKKRHLLKTHSHGTVQTFMLSIVGVEVKSFHELVLGHSRTDGCDSRHIHRLNVNERKSPKPDLYVHW
jgi:hypothetical protein